MSKPFDPLAQPQNPAVGQLFPVAYGGGKWRGGFMPAPDLTGQAARPDILQDAAVDQDGAVTDQPDHAEALPLHVVPLRGVSALLGEWLLDVLMKSAWISANQGYRLCSPALSPVQAEILRRLGQDDYINLAAPARFARLARFELMKRPPETITAPAAALRGTAPASGGRVAILPQHASEMFTLANRASLAAWLRAKRFSLPEPEAMSFEDLAATLSAAGTIMLADPRQAGLIALCQPGTKVIDIAPDGWRGTACQYLCKLFDLNWIPCDAGPLSYKLLTALPFGSRVPLSYEVPIGDLAKLLQTI
jgi:hypothetical protein